MSVRGIFWYGRLRYWHTLFRNPLLSFCKAFMPNDASPQRRPEGNQSLR